MTTKKNNESLEIIDLEGFDGSKKTRKPRIIGLDLGTMNIVAAINDVAKNSTEIASTRNMFLVVDNAENADLSKIDHIKGDVKTYIIGEHAYTYSNIFGKVPKRCMEKGLISRGETDSLDVLSLMIKNLIGEGDGVDVCYYSVPANPVDITLNTDYHKKVFKRILKDLGFKPKPVTQALSVIYSQAAKDDFSGIVIDYGSGMTNVCMSYKRNPALEFSVARGGDWIDNDAAENMGIEATGRITAMKEKDTDLSDFNKGVARERRIREAIVYAYEGLIEYSLDLITDKFDAISEDFSFPEKMPIIVSGGTSKANGFLELFREVFEDFTDFPIGISEIRHADDPLTAVAEGCLIKALSDNK